MTGSTPSKDELRRDRDALERAIAEAGGEVLARGVRCPFHDDRSPSGSIYRGEDGAFRFRCHGSCEWGGDIFDVEAAATGQSVGDVLRKHTASESGSAAARPAHRPAEAAKPHRGNPTPPQKPVYPSPEAVAEAMPKVRRWWIYRNPDSGRPELVVFRLAEPDGRKSYRQARPVRGGLVLEGPPKPWPLYRRDAIREAERVVVVEGEKAADALAELGVAATTSPGGAGNGAHADWSPLAGKTAILWPDADAVDDRGQRRGLAHMREVARHLEGLDPAPRMLWLDPDRLGLGEKPEGGGEDVVDWLESHADEDAEQKRASLERALEDAEPMGPSREVRGLLEDAIAGRNRAEPWPWSNVSRLTQALLPGTATLLCGEGGASKSLLLLQALTYWHEQRIRAAVLELEEDRRFHLLRALAQRAGESRLTDREWVRENPDTVRALERDHAGFLDALGTNIHTAPEDDMGLDDVAAWVETQAAAGARIIAVDPVTIAAGSDKPWLDDRRFLNRVKKAATDFECSLVLVTHPRKQRAGSSLDDLAGGAAYARFCQTVLWLEHEPEPKPVVVHSRFGRLEQQANRFMRIRKARNGKGGGLSLALSFDGATLRTDEVGIADEEK